MGLLQQLGAMRSSLFVYPLIVIVIVSIFSIEYVNLDKSLAALGYEEDGVNGAPVAPTEMEATLPLISGHVDENGQSSHELELGNVTSLTVTLTWSDEAPEALLTNAPDTLQLALTQPSGEGRESQPTSNPQGGQGSIELSVEFQGDAVSGSWLIAVIAGECGDQEGIVRTVADEGNDYTLQIAYTYMGVA